MQTVVYKHISTHINAQDNLQTIHNNISNILGSFQNKNTIEVCSFLQVAIIALIT